MKSHAEDEHLAAAFEKRLGAGIICALGLSGRFDLTTKSDDGVTVISIGLAEPIGAPGPGTMQQAGHTLVCGLAILGTLITKVGAHRERTAYNQDRVVEGIGRSEVLALQSKPSVVILSPRQGATYGPPGKVNFNIQTRNGHLMPPHAGNASSGPMFMLEIVNLDSGSDDPEWHECLDTQRSPSYTYWMTSQGHSSARAVLRAYLSSTCHSLEQSGFQSASARDLVSYAVTSEKSHGTVVREAMAPQEMVEASPMVAHLNSALGRALRNESKLSLSAEGQRVLELEGMSGTKFRHFLNNLLEYPGARYLEVGLWAGSTFCSSLMSNTLDLAVGVDDWSLFGGPRDAFLQALDMCRGGNKIVLMEKDYRAAVAELRAEADQRTVDRGFNFYLFDGPHEFEDQYVGISHAASLLAEEAIIVVDDYNWHSVEAGTEAALWDLHAQGILTPVYKAGVLTPDTSKHEWHNGIMAFVVSWPRGGDRPAEASIMEEG